MQLYKDTLFANRFRLVECKGRGSFGEVWLAHDEQLENMEVAIKVYIALDDRGVADFKSEYRNTFGLSHPNLLHAYQFDLCDNRPYLVMPYCPESAASLIGRADETTLWHFIRDVASGLAYLHDLYIVHHDIKPDNVLIDGHGNFLITDFGISTRLRTTLQRNSTHEVTGPKGSLPYMAPELFDLSAGAVLASDIWALGATLYEMASGELPFFGQGGAMLRNGATISRPNLPYSNGLIDTILECLEKEPWERPRAIDLAQRAQDVIDGHPYEGNYREPKDEPKPPIDSEIPDEPKPPYIPNGIFDPIVKPKPKKNWLWVLLAVVLVLVGGGFAAWKIMQRKRPTDEKEFFDYCEKSQKVEDYRAFVKQFPNSTLVPLAQNNINAFVQDSIHKLQQQKQGEEPPQPSVKDKEKEKVKKGGKDPDVKQLPTPKIGESISEMLGKTDSQKDPEEGDLTPVGDNLKKTPSGEKPKEEKPKKEKPKASNSAEEAFKECLKTNTVEAWADWMDKYGDTKTRDEALWHKAVQVFTRLYKKRAESCDTKEKCKDFITNHDRIMHKARLKGTAIDNLSINIVKDKLKELEKEETSSNRPITNTIPIKPN